MRYICHNIIRLLQQTYKSQNARIDCTSTSNAQFGQRIDVGIEILAEQLQSDIKSVQCRVFAFKNDGRLIFVGDPIGARIHIRSTVVICDCCSSTLRCQILCYLEIGHETRWLGVLATGPNTERGSTNTVRTGAGQLKGKRMEGNIKDDLVRLNGIADEQINVGLLPAEGWTDLGDKFKGHVVECAHGEIVDQAGGGIGFCYKYAFKAIAAEHEPDNVGQTIGRVLIIFIVENNQADEFSSRKSCPQLCQKKDEIGL